MNSDYKCIEFRPQRYLAANDLDQFLRHCKSKVSLDLELVIKQREFPLSRTRMKTSEVKPKEKKFACLISEARGI